MSMQVIALTSANEAAMRTTAAQLLNAAHRMQLQLSVLVGVNTAHEADAVYRGHGELWRIGDDDTRPELDALVDRTIDDSAADRRHASVKEALDAFLGKTRVAA